MLTWDAQALAGLGTYSFLWPAVGPTRSLYPKELYVAQTARGRGVGLLMDGLIDVAVANSCSRIEWTTDRDNTLAQRFYAPHQPCGRYSLTPSRPSNSSWSSSCPPASPY
ncbi:GNAT family N-acetyltransferase [Micromonospora sp. CA-111912]|uniref:GNAT family N-acetyltransferase n=1 Tax=Micromonospora sp. CA-111912 TaxID=3239955 RepID=UPI003D8A8E57